MIISNLFVRAFKSIFEMSFPVDPLITILIGPNENGKTNILKAIESEADNRVSDLHVWKIGPHHLSIIVTLVTHNPKPVEEYRQLLKGIDQIKHLSIEVISCTDEPCISLDQAT